MIVIANRAYGCVAIDNLHKEICAVDMLKIYVSTIVTVA
jgi:hypothetical protein